MVGLATIDYVELLADENNGTHVHKKLDQDGQLLQMDPLILWAEGVDHLKKHTNGVSHDHADDIVVTLSLRRNICKRGFNHKVWVIIKSFIQQEYASESQKEVQGTASSHELERRQRIGMYHSTLL